MSDLRNRIEELVKLKEERGVCDLSDIADMLEENEQLKTRVAELEKELEKSKRETDVILTTAERMKKELDDIRVKEETVTMHDEEGE